MSELKPSPYSKDYEITDAMFGVFRSPGGMSFFWRLFGCGTLLFSVLNFISLPIFVSGYIDLLKAVIEIDDNPGDVRELLLGLASFLGSSLLFILGYFLVVSLLRASFYRGYFFDEVQEVIPIRFGQDELRQFLAILGFAGLFTLFLLLTYLALIVAIVIVGLIAAFLTGDDPQAWLLVIGAVLFFILYVALMCSWVWFALKFVCAGALTSLQQKTHVLAARHVSKNRFWALFGSILVAGIIGYVFYYVTFFTAIMVGFAGMTSGEGLIMLTGLDPESTLEALTRATETTGFKISSVLAIIIASAGYTFYTLILAGPQAFFTKQWAEAGDHDELLEAGL